MTTSASCRRWWVGEASKPHPLDATINTLYSPPPTRRKAQAARRVTQKRIDNRPSDTDRPHAPPPPWLSPGRVCIREAGPMGPRWRLRDAGGPRRSGRGRRLGAPPRLHAEQARIPHQDPGLFVFWPRPRKGSPRRADRGAGDGSFTTCHEARHRYWPAARFVKKGRMARPSGPPAAPLRVCPCTPRPRNKVDGTRDVRGRRGATCSESPIRRDARARAQPKWIQINNRAGASLSGWKPAAKIGRRRNP